MIKRDYWPSLDGLRGLAVLLVIAHNVQLYEPQSPSFLGKIAQFFLNVGWVGVLLFFVLSGFLITGILIDSLREPHGVRNFLARRALRIFPLYYALLFVFYVLLPLVGMQPSTAQADAPHQIWFWLYLGNWTNYCQALPHIWSLAVEEQFYLVWPIVVYLTRTPLSIAAWSIAVAIISIAIRIGMWRMGTDPSFIYECTLTRMDALALGSFAASAWRIDSVKHWLIRRGRMMFLGGFALLLVGLVTSKNYQRLMPIGQIWGYTALGIFFMTTVWYSAQLDQSPSLQDRTPYWHRFLCWGPLQRVGQYSYAMYIFHKPLHDFTVVRVVKAVNGQAASSVLISTLHVIGIMATSYAMAWVSWRTFEMQFLKLKRHFE